AVPSTSRLTTGTADSSGTQKAGRVSRFTWLSFLSGPIPRTVANRVVRYAPARRSSSGNSRHDPSADRREEDLEPRKGGLAADMPQTVGSDRVTPPRPGQRWRRWHWPPLPAGPAAPPRPRRPPRDRKENRARYPPHRR